MSAEEHAQQAITLLQYVQKGREIVNALEVGEIGKSDEAKAIINMIKDEIQQW